ncbi:high affinity methionine permease [Ascoidea rubescens DSM 1968]|uniref:High affinity methionine permease n=1 Tax=Ascoidea rubescens DSM 1968 TaxID=1344418 RepID=A0A1D2VFC4_9ASCO|nr:high affinity methionine permease [Ascoidea rubescens DSM 1968]ODV60220.1 high affinity methionine permease [Ascoidea rubescens DSM 1968]
MSSIVSKILGDSSSRGKDVELVHSISEVDNNHSSDTEEVDLKDGGAPLESSNPLGYNVNAISTVVFILQGIVGTGIFATPGSILKSMGSIGSTYCLWIGCFFIQLFNVFVYIEFVTYYKKRNGGDVAYLEQAYPKPQYLIPTTFAAVQVVLSFITSSALAFGRYILEASDIEQTDWNYRGIALGCLTFACIFVSISTKWSLRLQNVLGYVKLFFMLFIVILGWVALGKHTHIENPRQNFHDTWDGTTTDGNAIANAIIKVTFSYGGYAYAFGVAAEHSNGGKSLVKTFTFFVPLSVSIIFVLYILILTSYYTGSSIEEIKASSNSIAALLFRNAFENKHATKFLNVMVSLSAFGHLITVVLSHSRSLRECGRQGVLPFPRFWTQIRPFGTPVGPIFIIWLVNSIMIVGPPAGSAYNFIVDLGSYSSTIFSFALIVGLLKVRKERKRRGLGRGEFKVPTVFLFVAMFFQLFVLAVTFVPPADGTLIGSDVTFFYATYPLVVFGILLLCVLYYVVWRFVLPKAGNYVHREIIYKLDNGELGNTIVKVPIKDVEQWDAEHSAKAQ